MLIVLEPSPCHDLWRAIGLRAVTFIQLCDVTMSTTIVEQAPHCLYQVIVFNTPTMSISSATFKMAPKCDKFVLFRWHFFKAMVPSFNWKSICGYYVVAWWSCWSNTTPFAKLMKWIILRHFRFQNSFLIPDLPNKIL